MKKEVFVKIINGIKAQREHDREISTKLKDIFIDFDGWYDTDKVIAQIEDALKEEFNDKNDWISYFIYDLDFGDSYSEGDVTEKDGTIIDISTVEKLYDFLVN